MKVIKSVAIVALSLAASSAFALSSNWEQFAENDQAKFYFDADTYQVRKTQRHLRQVWKMIVLKKPAKDGTKYYRTLVQHDCSSNQTRVAAIQVSDARDKTIVPIKTSNLMESPWTPVVPDSIIGEQHRLICAIPE
jgi:uncharacterized protein YjbK